ncbi:MAG: hypothetical protein OXU20_33860 [Myxococcales bacterium]|nr:hypothetical protein [Myxococcales bacterium]
MTSTIAGLVVAIACADSERDVAGPRSLPEPPVPGMHASDVPKPQSFEETVGDEAFSFGNYQFRLRQGQRACAIIFRSSGRPWQTRELDLSPPCHLFRWEEPPPVRPSPSGRGVPVGQAEGPQAYSFRAERVTAMAILGDPLRSEERGRLFGDLPLDEQRRLERAPCGASLQAVLLSDDQVKLGKKTPRGHTCADHPLEQKDFWLLVHR